MQPKIPRLPNYIVFDIETSGLRPCFGSRITCICAKDSDGNRFVKSGFKESDIIKSFLDWINERSPSDYFLITKNGKEFDIPFIFIRNYVNGLGCDRKIDLLTGDKGYEHLDLQDLTEKRVSLQSMAQLLGCTLKSGTGLNAIKLWNEGRFDKLKAYCKQDVDATEEVFLKWKVVYH